MRASETGRSLICPASLVLPRAPRPPSERREKAAAWGTLCHWWKEHGSTEMPGASPADVKCLEKKLVLSGVEREQWWPGGDHEVTFSISLLTEDPTRGGLSLWRGPRELADQWKKSFDSFHLTGTIDLLDWGDRSTTAWVDDLKTGRWPVDPATSAQLRSYALVPWIAAGCPMAWDGLVSITQWERYPLVGLPVRTYHQLSSLDLMEHLELLRWAAEHPDEVNPDDEACRFCDCKPLCPAWVDEDAEPFELPED